MDLQRRRILDGASLIAEAGSVRCLAGHNGAGKTTLLRVAAGIIEPREGTVRIGDVSLREDRRAYARQVSFLPAGYGGLYGRLSVRQNLELAAAIAYVPRKERPAAVAQAIDDFQLSELASRRSDRLSLGQRQRVRLALALVHQPRVVLLDEPHNSLDEIGVAGLATAMQRVADRGGAVVWAAPSPDQADLPNERTAVVAEGRVS